jgi:hypothetical protein
VYYQLGLFLAESEDILLVLIPSVVIGIPLGAYFILWSARSLPLRLARRSNGAAQ